MLVSDALKIGFDASEYLAGFAPPEFRDEPLLGRFVVLAVIAAIYAVAQRYDVLLRCTGTVGRGQRNPVVHRQSVPEPWRTVANSTATTEVAKGPLPVCASETVWQVALASVSFLNSGLPIACRLIAIIYLPAFYSRLNGLRVLLVVETALEAIVHQITFVLNASATFATRLKAIYGFIVSVEVIGGCGQFYLTYGAGFEVVLDSAICATIPNALLLQVARSAHLTHVGQPISILGTVSDKILCRCWQQAAIGVNALTAATTAFYRSVHSISPLLSRLMMASSGASDRLSGATLDAFRIIPQGGALCLR